jgi:hypothetical protein
VEQCGSLAGKLALAGIPVPSLRGWRDLAIGLQRHGEWHMTNQECIQCFEADTLPGEFHHADHIRLAFAYLSEYRVLEAIERFTRALKCFAAARGKAGRYHETITYAYLFLIRERMVRAGGVGWEEFAERNPDLFVSKGGILSRYYHEATLQSELARTVFLFPDRMV